jgi:hypothetical protein
VIAGLAILIILKYNANELILKHQLSRVILGLTAGNAQLVIAKTLPEVSLDLGGIACVHNQSLPWFACWMAPWRMVLPAAPFAPQRPILSSVTCPCPFAGLSVGRWHITVILGSIMASDRATPMAWPGRARCDILGVACRTPHQIAKFGNGKQRTQAVDQ